MADDGALNEWAIGNDWDRATGFFSRNKGFSHWNGLDWCALSLSLILSLIPITPMKSKKRKRL